MESRFRLRMKLELGKRTWPDQENMAFEQTLSLVVKGHDTQRNRECEDEAASASIPA